MENFNKIIEDIMGGGIPDTDSEIGNFGAGDAMGAETNATKIVLHLESGIEIHLPTDVCRQMLGAIEGDITPDEPAMEIPAGETEEGECPFGDEEDGESDEHEASETPEEEEEEHEDGESGSEEDDEKEDSDSDDDDDDDEKKSTALSEGCGKKHSKKKLKFKDMKKKGKR